MSITRNPIPELSIAELGAVPEYFTIRSEVHGPTHTNRVMFNAFALCRSMGWGELMKSVWAAALMHDIGRTSDSVEPTHGLAGAQKGMKIFDSLFKKAGLTEQELACATFASVMHSAPYAMAPMATPKMKAVAALLLDADVMDRIRLGEDPNTFRFILKERSPILFRYAAKLWKATCFGQHNMESVFEAGVHAYNPCLGAYASAITNLDDGGIANRRRRVGDDDPPASVKKYLDGLEIATYMKPECFDSFLADGFWKNFWQIDWFTSWHKKYHDKPEDGRAFNDMRLFKELAVPCTYAVIVDSKEQDQIFRRMYGDVRVTWRTESFWDCFSWTPEDSQQNVQVFKSSDIENRFKLFPRARYFEIQIHKFMRIHDTVNSSKQ